VSTIRLAGIEYEVRVVEGVQQVKHGGRWVSQFVFVDELMEARNYAAVSDLAQIGIGKIRGTLFDNSAQRTANMLQGARNN
jgi:hypothetical protein